MLRILRNVVFVLRNLSDAMMLFNEKWFNSAASRAYYASYQAMWAALGEPKEGRVATSCHYKAFCDGILV